MFISNNHTLFHLPLKKILVKYQKASKYYETDCSFVRKETVYIDILLTSRNDDRKIRQPIRITSRPFSRERKRNQLSQF